MSPVLVNGSNERRSARRFEVNFRVHWGREASDEFQGEVTDLSVGGCFIESGEEVREGDLLHLNIDIPERGALTVWGHIVFWVRDTGFGVRFTPFTQGGVRDRLESILDEEARRA